MKGQREEEIPESLTLFSELEEWPKILLRANPSPLFLAKLLRLSKRMRRFIWDFITSRGPWESDWHWNFLGHLRSLLPVAPTLPRQHFVTMQPFFVAGNGKGWVMDHYFPAKALPTNASGQENWAMLVFGTRPGLAAMSEKEADWLVPNWQLRLDVTPSDCFYWHFVARAFAAWIDTMTFKNSVACRLGTPDMPDDLDLCLL